MSSKSTAATPAFSLDDWIESGVVAQRTVTLHNDRSIPDRLAVLEKARAVAAAVASQTTEAGITDVPEVAAIDEDMEKLWDRWEASQETWVVRALSPAEIKSLREQFPAPVGPHPISKKATAAAKEAHHQASEKWADEALRLRDASDLAYLTWALLRVETSRGTAACIGAPLTADGDPNPDWAPAVTVAQLKAIRAKAGRQNDIQALLAAAVDATKGDIEVPAPFLQRTSRTDPS